MAEEVEVFLEVGVGVGVVGAEALAGEVGLGGGVEGGGEGIGPGVATGGVGAPAAGGEPAVASAGGAGQWSVGAAVSLWPTCSVTVSQRRVAIEVAGLAVWGGAQRRTKLTDEQVPLPLSALASALPLEQGTIGPVHRHRPKPFRPLCPPVDGVDRVDSGGQMGFLCPVVCQDSLNLLLILPGNREFCRADSHGIGRNERCIIGIDQVRTVDTQEVVTQQVLPLADAGFVAEAAAFGGIDRHLFVVGFDVENLIGKKGYRLTF